MTRLTRPFSAFFLEIAMNMNVAYDQLIRRGHVGPRPEPAIPTRVGTSYMLHSFVPAQRSRLSILPNMCEQVPCQNVDRFQFWQDV